MQPTRKLALLLMAALLMLALPMLMVQAQSKAAPSLIQTATPSPIAPSATPLPAVATAAPIEAQADTAIAVGDTVEGELTDDALIARYTFTGQQGDVVSITLTSDDFDAFLTLLDGSDTILVTNDDGAGSLNSRIDSFVLPADGEYTIEVSSFSRFSTGSYTLAIVEGGAPPLEGTPSVVTQTGGQIELGDTVSGTLIFNTLSAQYTFLGEAGQVITISLTSEEFDTYLRLWDPSGFEVAYDDDSGGNLDSRIGPYTLQVTGTYTIVVESFGG